MKRITRLIRFIRHWHARLGVLAAVFFLFLALTGVALNHTTALRLDTRQVSAPWLMQWYGLRAEPPVQGYLFAHGYFVNDDQRWVMDGKLLAETAQPVVGAVEAGGVRYVATAATLFLYQSDGSLLDKLNGPGLPDAPIARIGLEGNRVILSGVHGTYASSDGLEWRPASPGDVAWAGVQPLPDAVRGRVATLFAPSLPLERVLLDLHSGRVLGRYGPLAMDLAALVLIALSLSGVWIYLRSVRRNRGHHG